MAWLVESIPAAGPSSRSGDRVEIEVFVGGDAWLERLLLRLGPDARVVDPPEYRTLAAEAAARVLQRYGPRPPDPMLDQSRQESYWNE